MQRSLTSQNLQLDSQCDSQWSRNQQKLSQQQMKEMRRKMKQLKKRVWDIDQNYIYITYLTHFSNYLTNSATRRISKVYRNMAVLITTRSEKQVKSHHQKMMQKHGSIHKVIQKIQNDIMQHITVFPEFATRVQAINRIAQKFILKEQKRRKLMRQIELNQVSDRTDNKDKEEIGNGLQIKLEEEGEIRPITGEQNSESVQQSIVVVDRKVS